MADGRYIKNLLRKKLNENYLISEDENLDYSFSSGDCDIYALALHRLYKYPLYVVRGWFEDDLGDEGEMAYEDCHVVVKLLNGNYLDSQGEISEQELKQNCLFSNEITEITIEEISETEALGIFSCSDQEKDIKRVMNYIRNKNL